MMWLLLLFVLVPVIEIALFIEIGSAIGTWQTLGVIVATAVIGTVLLRRQGLQAMRGVQTRLSSGEDPGAVLADGAMILVSGVLLLTPGFFTDAAGFLLLIPAVRKMLWQFVQKRIHVVSVDGQAGPHRRPESGPDVVDGDFEEVQPRRVD